MNATKQARASVGGEIGANGEWYEGGKFIATINRAKGSKPTTTRRRPTRGTEHNMLCSQDLIDRANEWLSEHYPDLDGPEYDAKLLEVCCEIASIDAARDAE